MAFQKTTTTLWSGVTLATAVTDSNIICRTIPRTFEASVVAKVTFATSTADNVTVNVYASADNTTYSSVPVETEIFQATDAEALELTKAFDFKTNTYQYIRVTLDNADTTNTATVSGKLTEALI